MIVGRLQPKARVSAARRNLKEAGGKHRVRGKTLCMTALSLPLLQGFSTFHDINVFRCDVAEFSDNLAGYKRVICLNVKILQQNAPARSYEKTYNLAGIPMN